MKLAIALVLLVLFLLRDELAGKLGNGVADAIAELVKGAVAIAIFVLLYLALS